jgi:hypothetical protein
MTTLRRVCAATILSLTLAVSVFAGDIHSPGRTETEPSTTSVTTPIILTIVNLIYR